MSFSKTCYNSRRQRAEHHPGSDRLNMNFVYFALVGIAAGWLGAKLYGGGNLGVAGSLLLGVVGAVLGGFVFSLLGLAAAGLLGELVMATVGAVLALFLVEKIGRR